MNTSFQFTRTELTGVYEITTFWAEDNRGAFYKSYNSDTYESNEIVHNLKEVFFANSRKNVVRGMHFQMGHEQAKLVQCIKGKIWDVVVDLNPESPTYLKWKSFLLTEDNHKAVYIPKKCAHGYYVEEDCIVCYMCDECFYPPGDSGIKWNDPTLNITWPFEGEPILSEKDKKLMSFSDYEKLCNNGVKND